MKNFFLFMAMTGAVSANCPTNWVAIDEYVFQFPKCPSGYIERTDMKIVDNSTSCGAGWIETAQYKEVVCDTEKGTCGVAFTCPAP